MFGDRPHQCVERDATPSSTFSFQLLDNTLASITPPEEWYHPIYQNESNQCNVSDAPIKRIC